MGFLKSALSVLAGPVGAGIIQGAGSIAGSALSAKASRDAVGRQTDWERERARNAHQWEVEDLKAAGLNPILSAGGNGATTGGISAPMPDYSGVQNAASSAIGVIQGIAEAAKTRAELGKVGAEISNLNADSSLKGTEEALKQAQKLSEMERRGLISEQTKNQQLKNISEKIKTDNAQLSFWNNEANTASSTLKNIAGALGGAVTAKEALKGLKSGKASFTKKDAREFVEKISRDFSMPGL